MEAKMQMVSQEERKPKYSGSRLTHRWMGLEVIVYKETAVNIPVGTAKSNLCTVSSQINLICTPLYQATLERYSIITCMFTTLFCYHFYKHRHLHIQ